MLNMKYLYLHAKWICVLIVSAFLFQNCAPTGFQSRVAGVPVNQISSILGVASVVIRNPEASSFVKQDAFVSGSCMNDMVVEISGDVLTPVSTICSENSFGTHVQFSEPDGLKNIRVQQKDRLGNAYMDSRSFYRDTLPPAISIMTPAPGSYVGALTMIQGLCEKGRVISIQNGDSTTRFNCDNNGLFSQPLSLNASDGAVAISVSQTDAAGNTASTSVSFFKDTLSPELQFSSPAENATVKNGFNAAGTCETGLMVEIAGEGTLSSVLTPCSSGHFSGVVNLSTGNGSKKVSISQTDAAGNKTTVTRTFIRSETTSAPMISLTSPAEGSVTKDSLTITGKCTSGINVVIGGTGAKASMTTACSGGSFSAQLELSSGDGTKNIVVSQTNASGGKGLDSRNFILDATAPLLTLSQPAANSVFRDTVLLIGTCESGLQIKISGSGATANSSLNCVNSMFSKEVAFSSGEGTKIFTLSETDAAGNTRSLSRNFISDRTSPKITISSPAAGSSDENGLTVSGTCESPLTVTATGAGISAAASTSCSSGAYNLQVLFSNGAGEKIITVSQTDAAGNKGEASRSFKRTAPEPALDGKILYAQNCAACHSSLETSTKLGRSAVQISSAISSIPQMQPLSMLTSAQVAAISEALNSVTEGPVVSKFTCDPDVDPPPSRLERLPKTQYVRTLRDLFGPSINVPVLVNHEIALVPDEDITKAYATTNLITTEAHVNGYYEVANALSGKIATNSGYLSAIGSSCLSQSEPSSSCISSFITNFGLRAFRRPLSSAEKSTFNELYTTIKGQDGARAGIRTLIFAFLQSPQFLYHVEDQGTAVAGRTDLYQISPYELASRLSYFAWGSMPDTELFNAAADGSLNTQAGLSAQMQRLLNSPLAKEKIHEFMSEWLRLNPAPPSTYPASYTSGIEDLAGLRAAMVQDLNDFVDYVIWSAKGNYKTLMTSNVAVVKSMDMARIYGLSSASGTPVQVNPETRAGLLTRPAFLQSSNTTNNPFHRGATVLRRILCNNIPSPDPNSQPEGTLTPPAFDASKTTRQRFTEKTSPSSCVGCHSVINPIGFSLESFDSLGRFRTVESIYSESGSSVVNTLPIDSTGVVSIDGTLRNVENGIAMAVQIAGSHQGPSCFVENFHHFNSGREPAANDGCKLLRMETALTEPGGSVQKMISASVIGPEFRLRKVKP